MAGGRRVDSADVLCPSNHRALKQRLVVSVVVLMAAGGGLAADDGPHSKLTIERLYSLPNLIGTAPRGFAWSPDGEHLAFLWNDEGRNFMDVWVVDATAENGKPRRVTRFADTAPPRGTDQAGRGDDPYEAAVAREADERDSGVSSVAWGAGGHLLVGFRGDLWSIDPAGEATTRLTESESAERAASWLPKSDRIAFLRDGDVWTMDASGTAVQATELAGTDTRVGSFRWSPDGSRLAVLESDRRAVPERSIPDYLTEEPVLHKLRRAFPGEPAPLQRLGVVDLSADGAPTPIRWVELTDPAPDMLLSYRWSPDGAWLAVDTSDLYAKDRRIFLVDTATLEGRLLERDLDPENETFYFWRIAWATDSSRLYFLSDRDEDYHVWAVSPDRPGEAERLTRGSWAVAGLHPVPGGLVVVGNKGRPEERHLFFVADGGGDPIRLSHRPGTHSPTLSPDGRFAAVAFSSDDTPPDLWLTEVRRDGSASETTERRVTRSPLPEFGDYRWVTPSYVTFPSHVDGTTLHGRLTLPPDFDPAKTYPAILGSVYTDSVRNQWGGRTAHPTWGLDQFLAQEGAQEGYVLLNVDMRGSWGRGREHRRGIRLDYGGMDIEDLESGARFLAGTGYVDPERIGIWGSSYGGLMTAMSLFRKPGLYAAGIAGAPATNVWHALTGQMAVMMRPEDQPEEYADSSPFLHGDGLEDPLMIIHGMRDWIVLYKDSVTLVQRLIMLGKEDVELVTLPSAGHGWDNEGLAQTRFAFRKMVDFFDRYLAEPEEATE